jgi:hypothetical protein
MEVRPNTRLKLAAPVLNGFRDPCAFSAVAFCL